MKPFLLRSARRAYHWLPVSEALKWRLRERLRPVLIYLQSKDGVGGFVRAVEGLVAPGSVETAGGRSIERERVLGDMLLAMEAHVQVHGPAQHWIALPFLLLGGAQAAALNFCSAIRSLQPTQSVILLVTDRHISGVAMTIPVGVQLLVFDHFLQKDRSYGMKQALLMDLLRAGKPAVFHNVNSEVAWHLILEHGEQLRRHTRLFASIFAFQYLPGTRQKVGYAASFLKRGLPHLSGLVTDNKRFVQDAASEYALHPSEAAKLRVVYQPCRLASGAGAALSKVPAQAGRRIQVLWAGRLDAEKRVDLFLQIARACDFADFWVYGKVVLEGHESLPDLPNLHYEGPFASPLEWIDRRTYDALLFTSRWEGMPNILIEAGYLGLAVIAPAVGGVEELVNDKTGYLLAENPEVEDYLAALREIRSNPAGALERSHALHALVESQHSWPAFMRAFSALDEYFPHPQAVASDENVNDIDRLELPLVSVVVPCFNQGRYLMQSVTSALRACRNWPMEIIIVDDGSTDAQTGGWLAGVQALAPDVIQIHRQKNAGLSGARNSGVALSRGQYVQFLDADDLLAPGKIDVQVAQFHLQREVDVSVCNFLLCDGTVSLFSKPEEAIARFDFTVEDFLFRWERGFAIPIHCGLFRRAVLGSTGTFDTSARAKEDWIFWSELALSGARFAYVHGHWAVYRQHEASMRRSYMNMGRAWLKAGLHLDAKVREARPLFFESVVSWFEQCYRGSSDYRREVAELHGIRADPLLRVDRSDAVPELVDTVEPDEIVRKLSKLAASPSPFLTVVIPVHGHYGYLKECLLSLADQGDVAIEVVCIDDASPDRRISRLLEQLQGKLQGLTIEVLEQNQGISAVQNRAARAARGQYLAFLDCDDALEPRALQVVSDILKSDPEIDYVFTDRKDVDEAGRVVRTAQYGGYDTIRFSTQTHIRDDLLDGMVASHLKVIRKSVYLAVGGSDERYSGVQDWELALKIAERYRLHYLDQALYRHRLHSGSVTRSDGVAQMRKTNQVRRRFTALRYPRSADARDAALVKVFTLNDFPVALERFKEAWQQGQYCRVELAGALNLSAVNYLREFNSYVDQIVWEDAAVPVALFGYLHDEVELIAV